MNDTRVVGGYECPRNTSKRACSLLRKLGKKGILVITHDDGFGRLVRDELEKIAGAIGLKYHSEPYMLTVIDDEWFGPTDISDTTEEQAFRGVKFTEKMIRSLAKSMGEKPEKW